MADTPLRELACGSHCCRFREPIGKKRQRQLLRPSAVAAIARASVFGAFAATVEATVALSGAGQATHRAVLVIVATDPVEIVVVLDRGVVRIDQDRLEPFLAPVFADPVGIEYAQVAVLPGRALLGHALEVLPARDPGDALAFRASSGLVSFLASTALADAHASDDDALLCLVAERSSAVESRRSFDAFDRTLLAPALHALPLELGDVPFVGVLPGVSDV